MAKRNLRNIHDSSPVLSCHDLLEYRKKLDQTLPRSGMGKGYLPEENSIQQRCLPSLLDERLNTLQEQHAARTRDLIQAEWNPDKRKVYVTKFKGKFLQSAGEIINGKNVLYPEEALFLMETSALELHFNGAIQSIQEAYRLLLTEEMALEKFQVYSYLRRIGYIVVRHKKRLGDSSNTEYTRQAEETLGEFSRESIHFRQQISQALQKYSNKNEYYTNDYTENNEKSLRIGKSTDVKPKNKINSSFRCLWRGIDIPNIAGKTFLELEIPSLYLFPKNVCPQKQHYIIDLNASKIEAELTFELEDDSNYHEYYEHNVCNNDNTIEGSENQTYPSDTQVYNDYADYNISYNIGESESTNPQQFKNVCQDVHPFNQTIDESKQYDMPSTSCESTKLDFFPNNVEMQKQSHDINPHHRQDYVHNIHDNCNDTNKNIREIPYFNDTQTRTHDVPPSTEMLLFNMPYNKENPSQFENCEHNISHSLDHNGIPSSIYENASAVISYDEHKRQEIPGYKIDNSSCNQYEQSYEASKKYMHNSNCAVSSSDNAYQQSYGGNGRNPESSQFQNVNQSFCHSTSSTSGLNHRVSAQNYENAVVTSSVSKCGEQLNSNYEMHDSNYTHHTDQYGKSYEVNRNYGHNKNDSMNLTENIDKETYSDANKESLRTKETYKRRYVDKRNKNFKNKYINKKRKGRHDKLPEDSSPFPRISKIVTCWKEFKHEAELQSTAEYLMNGPAKVLWNNNIIPLVAPSEHLTKESVFGALSIIKNRDDTESCLSQPSSYGKLDFDVYLSTTNYSRYDPGPPNHRIKVVRCKDPTPIMGCEEKIPVHYAMVDNGTITFYSFSNVKLPNYV